MSVHFVYAFTLLHMTALRGARVLLTLYAISLAADTFSIGLLAAAFGLFPALLAWMSGRIADRFGARLPLTVGSAVGAVGIALPYVSPGLPAVFVAAALCGLSLTCCNVSLQNLVGVLSTSKDRTRNFSNYSVIGSFTGFLGPLAAGFAIDHAGYGLTCLYLAALPLLPLAMLVSWGDRLPRGTRDAPQAAGAGAALMTPGMWKTIAASGLAQIGTDLFQFYLPVYAHGIGLSASAIGVILAMFAAAAFVGRLLLPRLIAHSGERGVLSGSFAIGAAGLALVPLFENVWVLALISFGFGLGMGICAPVTMILLYSQSAGARSGEATGMRLTVDNIARMVGPVAFGTVAAATGLGSVFWISAALLGGGAWYGRREGRRNAAAPRRR